MFNKKNVHLIPHTHWDREWYFTSDDSRSMIYWDMRFLIEDLIKNKDSKFLYDGQTSIIDDFLQYSPDWKEKLQKVIKSKQLMVGPWYTQTDNLQPMGESILRNLEIGGKLAEDMGHRMKVGYLPDSFGHNPQTPQIMRQVGIDNFSFYRGLDPKKVNNELYFDYVAPSGDKVLGVWQTHYSTDGLTTFEGFMEGGRYDKKNHPIDVSVESYEKRSNGLAFWLPIGTDMKPYKKEIVETVKKLNETEKENFNYLISSYEDVIEETKKEIKEKNIKLPLYKGELREALTGRVHRSIISARMDLKQAINKLEDILVNQIEPLAYICEKLEIDVPWKMIERCWKDVFKSSAHDSYGGSIEDVVHDKIMSRLSDGWRVANAVVGMLCKIYVSKFKKIDKEKVDLFLINTKPNSYDGLFESEFMIGKRFNKNDQFTIYDGDKKIPYVILKQDHFGTHEREMFTVMMYVENIPPFSHKKFKVVFEEKSRIKNDKTFWKNEKFHLSIQEGKLTLKDKENDKTILNPIIFSADPSNGDTYDHSPITFNDPEYIFDKFEVIWSETSQEMQNIKFKTTKKIPNGLDEWKQNKTSIIQDIEIIITLIKDRIILKTFISNKSKNTRMRMLFNSGKNTKSWEHDMQFSVVSRKIENEYLKTWQKEDKYNAKWEEFPTNLSPHQSFIKVPSNDYAITTFGAKEHEVINKKENAFIALTLYRAVDVFGKSHIAYRPGRGSGAECEAPKAQVINKELEFSCEIFSKKLKNEELFNKAKEFNSKASFLDGSWGKEKVLLRWETNHEFYNNSNNKEVSINFEIPNGMIVSAIYKTPYGENIIRLFNSTNKVIEWDLKDNTFGFDLKNINETGKVKIKPWKLININI
ncbi:glycoside hydrolase family 38 N-terminal domain-containing protein [Mycoplasma marinum]|uniref:Glycoside hydrolase family 38 central domain-containing protein n=1 Tax=Mycoplasma marinum TaxID=1937190 RepID=A0A4R0XUQ1_9MOLU|nr:glycoside hydrolase family 38 C-terminal domain-containing protein [Mycoplasma marinum]TCG11537.1 hypothetical protein C4B24_01670 [Mycoplasma marinum]